MSSPHSLYSQRDFGGGHYNRLRGEALNIVCGTSPFILVGKGERGEKCGEFLPIFACHSCLHPYGVIHQCRSKLCPNCYKGWVSNETLQICAKLLAKSTADKFRRKKWKLKHVIFSPDFSLYHLDYFNLRRLTNLYIYAKSKGNLAGVLLFHAFRPNKRFWMEYGSRKEEDEEGLKEWAKKWEWIRSKENWFDYVDYSPHFHFIGWCGWLDSPEKGEEFVYKTITDKKGKVADYSNKKDLFRLVYYLLSHTVGKADDKYFSPVTWIGELGNRCGVPWDLELLRERIAKVIKERKEAKATCGLCGGKLWYINDILAAFFKVWLGVYNWKEFPFSELRKIVKDLNRRIPQYIRDNVLLCLDFIEGKLPPPDELIKYVVA